MKELVQQKSQNTNIYINNGVMKFGNKQTTHNKYAYKYKRVRDYSPEAWKTISTLPPHENGMNSKNDING
jgi:hypothetical protein